MIDRKPSRRRLEAHMTHSYRQRVALAQLGQAQRKLDDAEARVKAAEEALAQEIERYAEDVTAAPESWSA